MRRVIGILIAVALVLGGVNSWAASTAVPTISPDGRFIEWLCTSHTDGTVSGSGVQSVAVNGVITQMEVVPGAITPDATLDVDLNQLVNGITEDLTGSIFDNCSATGITRGIPTNSNTCSMIKLAKATIYPSAAQAGSGKTFYVRVWIDPDADVSFNGNGDKVLKYTQTLAFTASDATKGMTISGVSGVIAEIYYEMPDWDGGAYTETISVVNSDGDTIYSISNLEENIPGYIPVSIPISRGTVTINVTVSSTVGNGNDNVFICAYVVR